jgi:hypothetical protein
MSAKGLIALIAISLLVLGASQVSAEEPETPYMIYGWVFYENSTACDDPVVNITNTDNCKEWQAETHSGYNYYQIALANGTALNSSEMLQFNAEDSSGTQFKTLNRTVTQAEVENGGLFEFNITLEVSTVAPTVDSITITPDDDGTTSGVQINPNPGGAKTVTVSAVVSDPNGYGDISTVNITDITPDPALGDPSPVTLEYQSGSGSGTTATYNGTFDMQFYDAPIEYTVTVTAKDTGGLSDADSSTFNYTSCTAMSLDAATIAFGSIDPGENNTVAGDKDMNTTGSPTVRNTGNVEIDVNITGSDMTSGSDTITKDQMDAQVDSLGYSDLGVPRCFDVNIAAGALSLENVDFRLNVPYGIPAGSYTGSVTLTADTCGGS